MGFCNFESRCQDGLYLHVILTSLTCLGQQAFLKKGDMEAKMLSALLTGVNRAFPYAKGMKQ